MQSILFFSAFLPVFLARSTENDVSLELGKSRKLPQESRHKRQVLIFDHNLYGRRWPDGVVNYYFDEELDPRVKDSILRAMEKISNNTCVTFTTSPAEKMIRMYSRNLGKCYSVIGRTIANQEFVFDYECYSAGLAVHELTHSLGFMHAHQRADRDKYLDVDMDKFWGTEMQDQYRIFKDQKILVPYDYGSVMQYSGDDDTFSAKKPSNQYSMGSEVVAFYDYLMINMFYNCSCPKPINCQNHGYQNPRNCSKCNCPWGYGGDDCSERAEPGATLEASEAWKPLNVSLDAGYRMLDGERDTQIDYTYYFLWITAPANKTIEVKMEDFSGIHCENGCRRGGFEVKTLSDARLTSPRQCCSDSMKEYRSKNNPTIVMFFNSEGLDQYQLSYRYVDK